MVTIGRYEILDELGEGATAAAGIYALLFGKAYSITARIN